MADVEHAEPSCPICAKHRGEGPLVGPIVWADQRLLVTHRPVADDGTTFLGYLLVEPRRHVAYLDDLSEDEAEAIARTVRLAARGLRAELHPEFVFSAIIGMGIPHFHQHLFVRHGGTPTQYQWHAGADWPDAPHGNGAEVVDLCRRLRPYLERESFHD